MRNTNEKPRRFAVPEIKDNYQKTAGMPRRTRTGTGDTVAETYKYEDNAAKISAPRKFTLREREAEQAAEENAQRERIRGKINKKQSVPKEELEYERQHHRAPRILRFFAWLSLLVILFACGYLATNYFFNWYDKRNGERIGGVYGSSKEIPKPKTEKVSNRVSKYVLYIPNNGSFKKRDAEITSGSTIEEDVLKIFTMLTDNFKEAKLLDDDAQPISVFLSNDWLYLDMTNGFGESIKKLSAAKAESLLCGYTRTAVKNFPPVKKIKFFINSNESTIKKPVDLSQPWERIK